MLILSFTFSSVAANTQPPRDNAGDQPLGAPPYISAEGMAEQPDRSGFTVRPDDYLPPQGLISVDAIAGPISPAYEYIYTKTPVFYFYRDYSATRYRIEVYDIVIGSTVYTFAGAGTCSSYYCSLKPTTKLHNLTYSDDSEYKWRVQAKVGGVWQTYSDWFSFIVISKGFNNTFDTEPSKWGPWYGDWTWLEAKGIIKTSGTPGYWDSVLEEDLYLDFDYTVRMKRKYNQSYPNAVIIYGSPDPLTPNASWNDGIYFEYINVGYWAIWKTVDGVSSWIQDWTETSAIDPYGYNELRVVGVYPYLDLWINGTYLGWLDNDTVWYGFVGVSMFSDLHNEPLLVDSARLTSINVSALAQHDPAMQLGLEPVTEGMNPQFAPGNVNQDPTRSR